ncbi:MAG: phosphate-starvation-inducible PsiE family protein [Porticoccaceae bacterium]|nr:phosphate-starvation-inducible PsiE family protein [Porticoccaceae bacterium]
MTKLNLTLIETTIKNTYNWVISLVFSVILLFITIIMVIGVVRLFYQVGTLIQTSGITGNYLSIFTDVLTLFILVELSRSLTEYFTSRRLRLTPIIDAGIVFLLRHIMIELFHHKLDTQGIYAFSALLLALGAVRIGTSINFQRENITSQVSDGGKQNPRSQ